MASILFSALGNYRVFDSQTTLQWLICHGDVEVHVLDIRYALSNELMRRCNNPVTHFYPFNILTVVTE